MISSGFIKSVETYLGKTVAQGLVLIIVAIIAVAGVKTLWTIAVAPFIASVQAVVRFQSSSSYWDLITNLAILLLGIALSISLFSNWRFRKEEIRVQETFEKMSAKLDEALNDPRLKAVLDELHAEQALKNSAPKTSIVGQVVDDPPPIRPDMA